MGLVETQLDKTVTTLREIEDLAKKAMKAERRAVEETKETKRRKRVESMAERAAELIWACDQYISMSKRPTMSMIEAKDHFELV